MRRPHPQLRMAALKMLKTLDTLIAHKMINLSDALSGSDKRVAAVLIDHFNRKTGQCDPSLNTVADLIGVDRRTVVRCISRLVRSGLFCKIRHGGKFHRNSYEPIWSAFHHLDDAWKDRRKARRAASASPNVSHSEGQLRHSADGKDVTQTYPKNHFKETLLAEASNTQQRALNESKDRLKDFKGWSGAEDALERLKKWIGESACRSWFRDVEFVAYHDGIIVLSVLNVFYRVSITNRYETELLNCFRADYPKVFRIELEIRCGRANGSDREAS
jgi:hypothetical protein